MVVAVIFPGPAQCRVTASSGLVTRHIPKVFSWWWLRHNAIPFPTLVGPSLVGSVCGELTSVVGKMDTIPGNGAWTPGLWGGRLIVGAVAG